MKSSITYIKARNNQMLIVDATFDQVVSNYSQKPNTVIRDCRIDPNFKNKCIWIDGKNMGTIIF